MWGCWDWCRDVILDPRFPITQLFDWFESDEAKDIEAKLNQARQDYLSIKSQTKELLGGIWTDGTADEVAAPAGDAPIDTGARNDGPSKEGGEGELGSSPADKVRAFLDERPSFLSAPPRWNAMLPPDLAKQLGIDEPPKAPAKELTENVTPDSAVRAPSATSAPVVEHRHFVLEMQPPESFHIIRVKADGSGIKPADDGVSPAYRMYKQVSRLLSARAPGDPPCPFAVCGACALLTAPPPLLLRAPRTHAPSLLSVYTSTADGSVSQH